MCIRDRLSVLPATKNKFSVISPRSWKAIFFTTSAGSGDVYKRQGYTGFIALRLLSLPESDR